MKTPEADVAASAPLTDKDFYLNSDGLMVFTRAYHLKRGFCCKTGCLNCPWDYRKSKKA
jgi:hypothetical protein